MGLRSILIVLAILAGSVQAIAQQTVRQGPRDRTVTDPWIVNPRNSAGQELGAALRGQANIPLGVVPVPTALAPPSLLQAMAFWDGKSYAAFAPPNIPASQSQAALIVRNPDAGTVTDTAYAGSGAGTENSILKGLYTAITSSIPSGSNTIGAVNQAGSPWGVSIQQGGNTAAVNASSQLSVNCANCSGSGVSQQDNTAFVFGTTNMVPIGGAYSANPTPLTNGDTGVALLTQGRILEHNQRDSAGQELGASLRGGANVPVGVNQAPTTLTALPLLATTAFWDGKNYAAFAPSFASVIASQPALVTALSPNTPLPAGTNTIGAVTGSGTFTVGGTVTANQGGTWNIGSITTLPAITGTVTANQGGAPWTEVRVDTAGRQLGSSLPGAVNVPVVTTPAQVALAPTALLPSTGLWDGKNYAAFTPPSGSALAIQPAMVTTLSPNTPLPGGTNVLGAVTQSGGPWSVSGTVTANQGGAPWTASITQGGNTAAVNASSQLSVNCANCSGSGVSQQDATGFTFGTTNMVPIGGVYSAAPTALPNGQAGVALLTQGRILEANPRNSSGQELGAKLSTYSPPVQVNIASAVQNNTLLSQNDPYGQARVASMITDGTDYVSLTTPGKPPRAADSAIVVTPSPIPSLQCPFIAAVSQTASTTTVTNPGGKYLHVCSYKLVSAGAQNVGLIEGTGSTCGTGTTNLDGQGSSGSIALAANGGFQTGAGAGQVTIPMQVKSDNLCVVQSAASNVSGYVNYGIFN